MFPQVDYCYYKDTYKGQLVSSDEWESYSLGACEFINELTGGRLLDFNDDKNEYVKMAICALANYEKANDLRKDKESISSESVGGHSRSYNASATSKSLNDVYAEKKSIVYSYLARTNLLYRGVY
nr:MAG TPA: Head Tail Connector Protein [Caudoviricetes sp.]